MIDSVRSIPLPIATGNGHAMRNGFAEQNSVSNQHGQLAMICVSRQLSIPRSRNIHCMSAYHIVLHYIM